LYFIYEFSSAEISEASSGLFKRPAEQISQELPVAIVRKNGGMVRYTVVKENKLAEI
jgi:hypothetical protein